MFSTRLVMGDTVAATVRTPASAGSSVGEAVEEEPPPQAATRTSANAPAAVNRLAADRLIEFSLRKLWVIGVICERLHQQCIVSPSNCWRNGWNPNLFAPVSGQRLELTGYGA